MDDPAIGALNRKASNGLPRIIEFAGPAGSGKSSLRRIMIRRNQRIKNMPFPSKVSYLPSLLRIYLRWSPLYLQNYRGTKWLSMQEIRNIGYLDTWLSTIRSNGQSGRDIFVIDPGSVYMLSEQKEFGPEITRHPSIQSWWNAKFEQWSSALDVIIWMDAPEELCIERVLSRAEDHELKYHTYEEGLDELKRYREYYQKIIPEMAARHPIKVFYFRSDQIPTEQIADQIFCNPDFKKIISNSSATAA